MRNFLSQFEAIVFDLYGTLVDLSALPRLFPSYPPEFFSYWRTKQLEHTFLRTLVNNYRDFWQVTAETLEIASATFSLGLSAADRDVLLQAWLRLPVFAEVPEALLGLARNHSLAILSNGTLQMIKDVLEANHLIHYFQNLISADSVQRYKPAREVYALAPSALLTTPNRILFCSANGFDLAGAAHFGFVTCWVNRSGLEPTQLDMLGLTPDISVHGLDELLK
ncbi:haloacid dehalogenase type II [Thermorudis peleae]|uniref:haloacid dehalogenase type II n=1 Tax=Thermorudis peleae TaxID=1382356 RepID=UPI00056F7AF5|nr:haloacid dehalogenase type II [Thermorudis peleae]